MLVLNCVVVLCADVVGPSESCVNAMTSGVGEVDFGGVVVVVVVVVVVDLLSIWMMLWLRLLLNGCVGYCVCCFLLLMNDS